MTQAAIITGSTSGIGLSIAEAFAGASMNVMINGFGDADASKGAVVIEVRSTINIGNLFKDSGMSPVG